jgi:hypothetical protein
VRAIVLSVGWPCIVLLSSASCFPTSPSAAGVWGSQQASLSVTGDGAVLQILASGGCYGSYGDVPVPIPSGHFQLSGTYTQLTGVYPGRVSYAATYSGTVLASELTITVTVPTLATSLGPFSLRRGVQTTWPACLYP